MTIYGSPLVTCSECGRPKPPSGRQVPDACVGLYCENECPGRSKMPFNGDLWPGESSDDFGFPCWDHVHGFANWETKP